MLTIICGPSGCGKTTLAQNLVFNYKKFALTAYITEYESTYLGMNKININSDKDVIDPEITNWIWDELTMIGHTQSQLEPSVLNHDKIQYFLSSNTHQIIVTLGTIRDLPQEWLKYLSHFYIFNTHSYDKSMEEIATAIYRLHNLAPKTDMELIKEILNPPSFQDLLTFFNEQTYDYPKVQSFNLVSPLAK